jgi:alanyl-tRNA synthetase
MRIIGKDGKEYNFWGSTHLAPCNPSEEITCVRCGQTTKEREYLNGTRPEDFLAMKGLFHMHFRCLTSDEKMEWDWD